MVSTSYNLFMFHAFDMIISFHFLFCVKSLNSMGIKSLSPDFFKELTNLFSFHHISTHDLTGFSVEVLGL